MTRPTIRQIEDVLDNIWIAIKLPLVILAILMVLGLLH